MHWIRNTWLFLLFFLFFVFIQRPRDFITFQYSSSSFCCCSSSYAFESRSSHIFVFVEFFFFNATGQRLQWMRDNIHTLDWDAHIFSVNYYCVGNASDSRSELMVFLHSCTITVFNIIITYFMNAEKSREVKIEINEWFIFWWGIVRQTKLRWTTRYRISSFIRKVKLDRVFWKTNCSRFVVRPNWFE